jgi:hypothetical protein
MTAAPLPAAVTCSRVLHWWPLAVSATTRCLCGKVPWKARLDKAATR